MFTTAVITAKAIWQARKITTRNTSIFLDRKYIAYNRVMTMTYHFCQVNITEILKVSSSPPSMIFKMKYDQSKKRDKIAPENRFSDKLLPKSNCFNELTAIEVSSYYINHGCQ